MISNELVNIIVPSILFFIIMAGCLIGLVYMYQARRQKHFAEMNALSEKYQKEFLQSQLEIKEQTFATISQEIHDNIGQALSLAKLQLGQLQLHNPDCNTEDPRNLIAQAITDLRDLAHSLNPDHIQSTPLEQNLMKAFKLLEKSSGIKTHFNVSGNGQALSGEHKIILYRMFQELMNNTIKHAQAENLWGSLKYQADHTLLMMKDDGKGFSESSSKGIGLSSIQKRATLIGATLNIESIPNEGVTISINVPNSFIR